MNRNEKLITALLLSRGMPAVRRALLKQAKARLGEIRRAIAAEQRGGIRRVANRDGIYS